MVFIINENEIFDKIISQKGADKGSLRLIWSGESKWASINEHWQGDWIIGFIIFWSLATLQSTACGNFCPFWVRSFSSTPAASRPLMNILDASFGSIFWTASAATSCFQNWKKNLLLTYMLYSPAWTYSYFIKCKFVHYMLWIHYWMVEIANSYVRNTFSR